MFDFHDSRSLVKLSVDQTIAYYFILVNALILLYILLIILCLLIFILSVVAIITTYNKSRTGREWALRG